MEHIKSFKYPNSNEWISSLLSYFMNIKSIDDNIENIRLLLCSQNHFDPKLLFNYLDVDNKGFLLTKDFAGFLNKMQIPFEERNLRKFIHNFDKDSDFSINLKEFLGLIIPKKNLDLNRIVLSNVNNFESGIINKNIKYIFGKLLCEELELVKNCIKTAKFCRRTLGFTCYEGFIEIAGKDKYITEKHLYNFLSRNNIMISSNDIHQLMFRIDADNDGNISFDEFKEIFFPMKEGGMIYRNNDYEEKRNIFQYNTISTSKEESVIDLIKNSNLEKNIDEYKLVQNKTIRKENINNKILIEKIKEENLEQKYYNTISGNENNFVNSPIESGISLKKNNYPNYNNNSESSLFDNNFQMYTKTENISQNCNKLSTQKRESKLDQESYSNFNDINNTIPSTLNKVTSYKNCINDLPLYKNDLGGNLPTYKDPKFGLAKLGLNYDYTAFSELEGDEYIEQKKIGDNSRIEANRNYRVIKDNNIENKNYFFNNSINNNYMERKNLENKKRVKSCCGCPLYDNLNSCPNRVKYIENCINPKSVKTNLNNNSNSSYQRNYYKDIKNNYIYYKKPLKSQMMNSKSHLSFFYDNKEKDINKRKFNERRFI